MNKSEEKAKAEADRVEAEDALADVELELEQLANYKLQGSRISPSPRSPGLRSRPW